MDKHLNFLSKIEKPSRYLGSEINSIHKDLDRVKLHVALAFPDLYEIGTSHFGLQILYHILNSRDEIAAERVFAPALDLEAHLRQTGSPLLSLESKTPLQRFDIVGFSLLYELNYTNVLTMLELGGIPWLSAERDSRHPLVIAGGPCTCNPEPMAEFFDAMIVGDGEDVVLEIARTWLEWKNSGARDRRSLLKRWVELEGVYIPAFFDAQYDSQGLQTVVPLLEGHSTVKRAVVADLNAAPFPERPIIPFGKPVHDRLRLEISRGCTRGCRFCQAGMLYRPVRERSAERLFDLALNALSATGYEDLSLLSLSTGDYGCIGPLLQRLMYRLTNQRVAVSLPSLRAGTLTPELMELIKKVRKTGFTIAPEAGSQRLRDVINKNISETDVFETVQAAFSSGWRLIKLYFMIGLPTETDEDLIELVKLVHKLRRIKGPSGRRSQLNISVATFIPKPHTPFQWAVQTSVPEAWEKIRWLQKQLAIPGIDFKWQNPEMSFLEGIWARGDRRLGSAIRAAHRLGCRFDGWGDQLKINSWLEAFAETGIDQDFFTRRLRKLNEALPWDHIDALVTKPYLQTEWQNALNVTSTADCREGGCNACGSCDFDQVKPLIQRSEVVLQKCPPSASEAASVGDCKKIQIYYSKIGLARFFGHLELVNIFLRALRRAGIPLKFSQGFHPKPKVSFDNPLPTGFESEEERMVVTVSRDVSSAALLEQLNNQLPNGLQIHECTEKITQRPAINRFRIFFEPPIPDALKGSSFKIDLDHELSVFTGKGKLKKIFLKDILKSIHAVHPGCLEISLSVQPDKSIRPTELLAQLFKLSEKELQRARFRRLKNVEI
jgi:radical SAM family uncharacterized protein/radical SAM-linked protein